MQRPTLGESLAPIVIALVIALLLSPVVRGFTRDLVRGSQGLRHPAPASAATAETPRTCPCLPTR